MMLRFKGGPWDGILTDDPGIDKPACAELTYTRLTNVRQAPWDESVWQHTYSTYVIISTPDPDVKDALFLSKHDDYHTHFKQVRKCGCEGPVY